MIIENGTNHPATLNERIDLLAANLKSVVEHLATRAGALKDKAVEAKVQGASKASAFTEKTARAIKDHPIAAIGIAFGVGYFIMRLVRR